MFSWIQHNPLLTVVIVLAILTIAALVRRVIVFFALVALVVALFSLFSFMSPDSAEQAASLQAIGTETVLPAIQAELDEADYVRHPDGAYELKTKSVHLSGMSGETRVTIHFLPLNQSFEADLGELGAAVQTKLRELEQAYKPSSS